MVFTTFRIRLASHLDDPVWRIVDVRHQLADPRATGKGIFRRSIPSLRPRSFRSPRCQRSSPHRIPGFGGQTCSGRHRARCAVVIYDDSQGMIAGRLWWLLRALATGGGSFSTVALGLGSAGGPGKPSPPGQSGALLAPEDRAWLAVDAATLPSLRLGRPGALIIRRSQSGPISRRERDPRSRRRPHPRCGQSLFPRQSRCRWPFQAARAFADRVDGAAAGVAPRMVVHHAGPGFGLPQSPGNGNCRNAGCSSTPAPGANGC